jgi:cytochrome c553
MQGVAIHEMKPKSLGGKAEIDNQVLLCNSCHTWAHALGAMTSLPTLIALREKFLERYSNEVKDGNG